MEIWKDIDGYNGKYQISNKGEVRSFSRWKNGDLLKGGKCGKPGPYRFVALVGESRKDVKHFYIHRLVAKYFVDNPNGYNEVNHIDGNTLNNCAENLEWCCHLRNMQHAFENGKISHEFERGSKNKNSKAVYQKTKDGKIVKVWESVNQIQRETNYLASNIFCCCNHRKHYKTAYGYIWEYANGKTDNKNKTKENQKETHTL
jgi:hypothetical protein